MKHVVIELCLSVVVTVAVGAKVAQPVVHKGGIDSR